MGLWDETASGIVSNASAGLLPVALMCFASYLAEAQDKEPAAIIELGGAASGNVSDGKTSFGPNFARSTPPVFYSCRQIGNIKQRITK